MSRASQKKPSGQGQNRPQHKQQANKPPKSSAKQAGKRAKRRRKSNAKAAKEFWGDLDALPAEVPRIRASAEPAAVVASLGKAPLHGHEAAADQYLKVAYQRAVLMAGALAAAGDLVEAEE
ncbi:MAG: hypothetical protein ACRBI6_08230 [Acidimicrobiales bacterium]